jgi:hypothetical protein
MAKQNNLTGHGMKRQQAAFVDDSIIDVVPGQNGRVREKLEHLYSMRAEIEADIQALKRSSNILGEHF